MKCTARRSNGEPCGNHAVKGFTVCRKHGGASPVGPASPAWRHGRYSKHYKPAVDQKFADWDAGEPLDLADELDLMRMLLAGYLEQMPDVAAVSGEDQPSAGSHLSTVVDLVDAIKGLALAQQKLRADTAFTPAEAQALMSQLGEVTLKYVPAGSRTAFVQELRQLFGGHAADRDVEEIGAGSTLRE
jgi:hypothetical protein